MRDRPLIRTVVIAAAVVAVYALHDSYGITWDEPVQSIYGDLVRAYFVSGGTDRRADSFLDLRYYGPFVDVLPSLLHPANDLTKYQLRHVLCGLFAVLTIMATWAFARRTPGHLAAPFAILALAMTPRFVGHAFDNLKDVPFACAMTLFVVALTWMNAADEQPQRRMIYCGLAAGLVLAVRPGGFPLVVALLVVGSAVATVTLRGDRRPRLLGLLGRIAAVLAIAWIAMVLPWPYAHRNPLGHPIEAMVFAASFPYAPHVLFDGTIMRSVDLPRTYMFRMLAITTPPGLILLALVGLGHMARTLFASPRSASAYVYGIAGSWLLVPLLAMVITRPNVYDGIRHVLFVLPAVAVAAGVGGAALVERLSGHRRVLGTVAIVCIFVAPGLDLIRLHPYQTTYFNFTVGGLAGAEGRFDTDYWASSYKEAFDWVNERARRTPTRAVHVLVAGTSYLGPIAELYRAPNVRARVVDRVGGDRVLPDGVDYCIATSRWGYAKLLFPESPVVHSIGRDGAVFTVIRGREAPQ